MKAKITIDSALWKKALNVLGTVVSPKSTLPILGDVLLRFDAEKNLFNMMTSDSESWLSIECTDQEGNSWMHMIENDPKDCFTAVCISFIDLKEAVSLLPASQPLQVCFTSSDHVMRVNYGVGEFTIPFEEATEFPVAPEVVLPTTPSYADLKKKLEDAKTAGDDAKALALNAQLSTMVAPVCSFTIAAERLLPFMKQAYTCSASDELRPVMNTVVLDCFIDRMVVVSSDGHSLYKRTIDDLGVGWLNWQTFTADASALFMVPKTVLKTLTTAFTKGDVTLAADSQRMEWRSGGTVLTCRLIEGRYPNYNSVIPQNNTNCLTIEARSLSAALRRISLFANESSNMTRITYKNGQVELLAENYDFSKFGSERVAVVGEAKCPDDFSIAFKITTLLELLSLTSTENVILHFSDSSHAALITEEDKNSNLLLLIMPMQIMSD